MYLVRWQEKSTEPPSQAPTEFVDNGESNSGSTFVGFTPEDFANDDISNKILFSIRPLISIEFLCFRECSRYGLIGQFVIKLVVMGIVGECEVVRMVYLVIVSLSLENHIQKLVHATFKIVHVMNILSIKNFV